MQNSLKDYKSNFSWRNDTIYDGDSPIASFRHGGNEDLSFQDVVLKPGGEPVIKWVVSWQAQFKNFTNVLEKAVINDEDHERLKMEFVSHSPNKYYSSHVEMELTYNSQTKSYQYEVETVLTVNKFPFATWGEFCEKVSSYVLTIPTEYANIWPLRPCEFENWIYKNVDGGWTKLPLNPLYPSGLYNIQFNRLEGILGLFGSKSGPVVHLLGNTPSNTKGDLCFNAWDMHLKASPVMASRKFWAKYKLLCYSKDSCEKIEQKAEYVHYLPEEIAEYERPRFNKKVCDFTESIHLDNPDQEAGLWIPFGDVSSSKWLKHGGFEDKGCILNEGVEDITVSWQAFSKFAPFVERGKKYEFSAYVKTDELDGHGAYIFYCKDGKNFDIPQCACEKITGTGDWKKVSVTTHTMESNGGITLVLQHKGKGKSWFSNVEFKKI